jgi:hypothetical protein
MQFRDLMALVTPMLVSQQLTQSQLQQVTAKHGLTSLAQLGARPDLIAGVYADIMVLAAGGAI